MVRSTTKINDECHDEQTNDSDDLYTGKYEFGLAIDCNGEEIEAKNKDDDEGDPYCNTDVLSALPVVDNDGGGGNLSTESNRGGIPILGSHWN